MRERKDNTLFKLCFIVFCFTLCKVAIEHKEIKKIEKLTPQLLYVKECEDELAISDKLQFKDDKPIKNLIDTIEAKKKQAINQNKMRSLIYRFMY